MVISTATVPPYWIAACSCRRAGQSPATTTEQPFVPTFGTVISEHSLSRLPWSSSCARDRLRFFSELRSLQDDSRRSAESLVNSSVILGAATKATRLALGELEALAGALLPVLLALLHTRIARE